MEELQNTIQDAQYMGAMVDPTPRPAAQMPVPKSSRAVRIRSLSPRTPFNLTQRINHRNLPLFHYQLTEFQESLLANNPNVFSMEAVVQTPMGFYLFKRFC